MIFKQLGRRFARRVGGVQSALIRPLLSAGQSPEYVARSVAVGLFVAFTPTVGLQVVIVFVLWGLVRPFTRDLAFNPIVASAWTICSNVFTIAPIYYVFVQTGRIILGRWANIRPYDGYLTRDSGRSLPFGRRSLESGRRAPGRIWCAPVCGLAAVGGWTRVPRVRVEPSTGPEVSGPPDTT